MVEISRVLLRSRVAALNQAIMRLSLSVQDYGHNKFEL
jgi:hypothetical protein